LPRFVELVQRFVPDAQQADAEIDGSRNSNDARQNRESSLRHFHTDHFLSILCQITPKFASQRARPD
jgi:hypothetical protein